MPSIYATRDHARIQAHQPAHSINISAPDSAELNLWVESRKKSGWIAALLNLFLPGAGYIYCGRWFLGIFVFFFVILMFVASFGLAAFAIAFALFIDGFLCASRYNKALIQDILYRRGYAPH